MTNKIIQQIEAEQMSKEIPAFAPGDTVIVQVKVKEGDRQRLQAFEGVVIGKRNRGLNSAFTVRKISNGVGVERTFQTYSPLVDSISSSVAATCARPSCTTSANCPARQLASRKNWPNSPVVPEKSSPRAAFFLPVVFRRSIRRPICPRQRIRSTRPRSTGSHPHCIR